MSATSFWRLAVPSGWVFGKILHDDTAECNENLW
jgi:hypothetical protein